jgi:hypothetical protein
MREELDQNMKLGRLLRLEEEAVTALAERDGLLILATSSGTITLMDQVQLLLFYHVFVRQIMLVICV